MTVEFKEVGLMTTLDKTLLSLSKLQDSGVIVDFQDLLVHFPNGSRVQIYKEDGLYYIKRAERSAYSTSLQKPSLSDKQKAHLRFGHMSSPYLDALIKQGLITGLQYTVADKCFHDCKACNVGKLTRGHHKSLGT